MKRSVLLGVATASVALAFSIRLMAHSADEPVPRNDEWWRNRHQSINENVARVGKRAEIIFIGDSITQGWEGAGRQVWEEFYAPRNALNLGIGGDRTQHVLWRLDNGNLEGIEPKVAVVMIGTNNSNGEDNSVSQIADGVTAIVRKLREKLPSTRILLLGIFPRSENPSPQRGKILQVNQILRRLADGEHVFWMDFGHKFVRADGTIPADLMPDFLHLSPAGYRVWAESIEPRLVRLLGGSASNAGARTASRLAGRWVASIPGPEGEPVEMQFEIRREGGEFIGAFLRPGESNLPIRNIRVDGSRFSWTVDRARPDGSVMTYEMSGVVENDRIEGRARASEVEGVTIDWTARRR